MLYTFDQCKKKYGSAYQIKKAVGNGELFFLEKGVYSSKDYEPGLLVISMKYPNAVITSRSAYYFHNLTDDIPDKYHLATSRGARKITDPRVVQTFENGDVMLGAEHRDYKDGQILIYNKERMLVELLRNKQRLPFDYYKEVLLNYRKIIDDLDISLIQDYIYELPKSNITMNLLQLEVL